MSISQTKNFFEKTGCGIAVLVTVGVVMAVGLMAGGNCQNQGQQQGVGQQSGDLGPAIITVGKTTIPAQFFAETVEVAIGKQEADIQSQIGQEGDFEGLSPRDYAIVNGQVLIELEKSAYLNEMASDAGFNFDFKASKNYALKKLEKAIISAKGQLIVDGKLKADADKETVNKAFTTAYERTPDGIRSAQTVEIDKLQGEQLKLFVFNRTSSIEAYTEKLADEKIITDAEMEGQFESFKVKMIGFAGTGTTSEEMKKAADAAKADLDKGMSFEAAITKYSKIPSTPGRSRTEETIDIPASLLDMSPGLNGLRPLKDGEISPILNLETGPIIYKLIKREMKFPEGYAIKKPEIKTQIAMQKASQDLLAKLEEKRKAVKPVFSDPAIGLMIEAMNLGRTPDAKNVVSIPKWKALAEQGQKLISGGNSNNTAVYVFFACASEAYNMMKPDEQKAYGKTYVDAAEGILRIHDNGALRLQIFDYLNLTKDGEAADALLLAANANTSYGPMGLSNNQTISTKMDALKKANMLPAAIEAKINKAQQDWIKTQKELAAERKLAADEAKAAEVAEKKAQEDARKEEEAAQKAAGTTEGSGTAPAPEKPGSPSSSDLLGGSAPAPVPSGQ